MRFSGEPSNIPLVDKHLPITRWIIEQLLPRRNVFGDVEILKPQLSLLHM